MKLSAAAMLTIAALLIGFACAPKPDPAAERAKIEKIVGEYIRSHPEEVAMTLQKFVAERKAKEERLSFRKSLEKREDVPVDGSPSLGEEDAAVTLVEFSDFQCPFCARASGTLERVKKKYKGKLRVVFKNMPLTTIHPLATDAALAALAAGEQGKFWEYRDILMNRQKDWGKDNARALFVKYAGELALDTEKFENDMDNVELRDRIERDKKLAEKLNVRATPTFFINGVRVQGAVGEDHFSKIIDALLAEKLEEAKDEA